VLNRHSQPGKLRNTWLNNRDRPKYRYRPQ